MGASTRIYERLLAAAQLDTRQGAQLAAERVYYSTRQPVRGVKEFSSRQVAQNQGRRYRGKLREGQCVDISDPDAACPCGLSGHRIGFICNKKPKVRKEPYARSGEHRGINGLLEDSVECTILTSFVRNV